MTQQKLNETSEFYNFIQEFKEEMTHIQKTMGMTMLSINQPLNKIAYIYKDLRDIKDDISLIKNCLINKKFLDEDIE